MGKWWSNKYPSHFYKKIGIHELSNDIMFYHKYYEYVCDVSKRVAHGSFWNGSFVIGSK